MRMWAQHLCGSNPLMILSKPSSYVIEGAASGLRSLVHQTNSCAMSDVSISKRPFCVNNLDFGLDYWCCVVSQSKLILGLLVLHSTVDPSLIMVAMSLLDKLHRSIDQWVVSIMTWQWSDACRQLPDRKSSTEFGFSGILCGSTDQTLCLFEDLIALQET